MQDKMMEVCNNIRDFARMRNIKDLTVVQVKHLLSEETVQAGNLRDKEVWGADPVHMTPKAYSEVASGIVNLIMDHREVERSD